MMRLVSTSLVIVLVALVVSAISIQTFNTCEIQSAEKNAAESLKALAANNGTFKNVHSSACYWVGDVYGLFDIKPRSGMDLGGMKICEKSIANADGLVLSRATNPYNAGMGDKEVHFDVSIAPPSSSEAKKGYFFRALIEHEEGKEWKRYDTEKDTITRLNPARFGYIAYPQKYGKSGKNVFKIETSTSGVVYKIDPGDNLTFAKADTYSRWEKNPTDSKWQKDDGKYSTISDKFTKEIAVLSAEYDKVKKSYEKDQTEFQKGIKELTTAFQKICDENKEDIESSSVTIFKKGIKFLSISAKISRKDCQKYSEFWFNIGNQLVEASIKIAKGDKAVCGLKHVKSDSPWASGMIECPLCDGKGVCQSEKCDGSSFCPSCRGFVICLFCIGEGTTYCQVCSSIRQFSGPDFK